MRTGRGPKGRSGANQAANSSAHGSNERDVTLVEELEHTRLLTDEGAWATAGAELRRRDPTRYVAILKVVEEICSIYRAPLEPVSVPSYVIARSNDDDFD